MHKFKKIWILLILMLCVMPFSKVHASGSYTISEDQIHIEVDKSAVLKVEETIQIKDCHDLQFYKDIVQEYAYDADQDGTLETYTYEISNIHVEGADFSTSRIDGKQRVTIKLEQPNAQIVLRYQVRMRKIALKEGQMFLYQLFAASHDGTVERYSATIDLPNRPETSFNAYEINESMGEGNAVTTSVNEKSIIITGSGSLEPGQGVMVSAQLRAFYFNYSHPVTLHLFFTIFSIILVMGAYFAIIYSNRFHKKDVLKECYPIEEIEIGSLGYILDGVVDETDIISILIEWANQNYIQIRDENQTVALFLINELQHNAPVYEQHLFNLIFTNYRMVTIDQLRERNLRKRMIEIEHEIFHAQEQKQDAIYANHSYVWQLCSAIGVCIPLGLTMFACIYGEQYLWGQSLLYASFTMAIVYLNCLPWIWIIKNHYRLSKNTYDINRILTMMINFICGALMYRYLLEHETPVAYVAINCVLTVLFACILIFMDRWTFHGRTLRMRLLSLRQFIRRANSEQLTHLLYDNPYYFEDMLPYAYLFDITDIWGKKFTSIPLQAPVWYFHANADAQSTIYWMSALEHSLKEIQEALYHETATMKQNEKVTTKKKAVKSKDS